MSGTKVKPPTMAWFRLSKYDAVETLDAAQWLVQLRYRLPAWEFLDGRELGDDTPIPAAVKSILAAVKKTPIVASAVANRAGVWRTTVRDLRSVAAGLKTTAGGADDMPVGLFSKSEPMVELVSVDWALPTEVLMSAFKALLSKRGGWRGKPEGQWSGNHRPVLDPAKWATQAILPLIDIQLWHWETRQSLRPAAVAHVLGFDDSATLRKQTIPNARDMMTWLWQDTAQSFLSETEN